MIAPGAIDTVRGSAAGARPPARDGVPLGRDGKPGPVLFPPKEADPATGMVLDECVELPDRGTPTQLALFSRAAP